MNKGNSDEAVEDEAVTTNIPPFKRSLDHSNKRMEQVQRNNVILPVHSITPRSLKISHNAPVTWIRLTVSGSPAEVFGADDWKVSLTQCRAGIELPGNRSVCQIQQVPNQNQPTRGVMVPGHKTPALPVATGPLDPACSSL